MPWPTTVDYLVPTKWEERDLRKRQLFLIHTKVLACVSSSPVKPWALIIIQIIIRVGNTFLKMGKERETSHLATGQVKGSAGVPSPGGAPGGAGFISQSPSLASSELGIGEGQEK